MDEEIEINNEYREMIGYCDIEDKLFIITSILIVISIILAIWSYYLISSITWAVVFTTMFISNKYNKKQIEILQKIIKEDENQTAIL